MLTCFLSVFPRWDETFLMILDQTEVENEVGVISDHRLVSWSVEGSLLPILALGLSYEKKAN